MPSPGRILLVEDDAGVRFGVTRFLTTHGFEVCEAENRAAAQAAFGARRPDIVVVDYRLPDGTALELMASLRQVDPDLPVVILTAFGTIDLAVRAIKEGAEQFLTKPVELPVLLAVLERLSERRREHRQSVAREQRAQRQATNPFLGMSAAIARLADQATLVAQSSRPVLLQGESGTGKGVLAAWIHRRSPRAAEAFVDLNCAGLSRELLESELFGHAKGAFTGAVAAKPGLFEIADRGTLFLDEIGDLEPLIQAKLLKVVEDGMLRRLGEVKELEVDARLIAATHCDLHALQEQGRFRRDLYFRISTLPLHLPALRERPEDIPVIATALLDRAAASLGRRSLRLSDEALAVLQIYPWPGNIRELRNVLERAVLLTPGDELGVDDLRLGSMAAAMPRAVSPSGLAELERQHIERALREERGHVSRAANRLGIPRSTLYKKLKRLGLKSSTDETPVPDRD